MREAKGPDATLAEELPGKGGLEVLHKMIQDGAISTQETAAYASNNKLTPEGKIRFGHDFPSFSSVFQV